MSIRPLALLAALLLAPPSRADLLWKGKSVDVKALPEGLAPEVAAAAAPWLAWAKKHDYHLWVSDAGDCILLAEERFSGREEYLALAAATVAASRMPSMGGSSRWTPPSLALASGRGDRLRRRLAGRARTLGQAGRG